MTEALDLTTPRSKITEHDVLTWLRTRYGGVYGNGQRWVYATQVRSHAGFDATRTADAVAMDLWPSKGLALHGHEVKVSRSDWLRELKDREKWRPIGQYMDRWWVVVPDRLLVHVDELPAEWGLLVATSTGVRQVKAAPRLKPLPVSRTFLASLLRAATYTAVVTADRTERTSGT